MSIGYALEKLRAVLNAKVIETAALAGPVLPLGRPGLETTLTDEAADVCISGKLNKGKSQQVQP